MKRIKKIISTFILLSIFALTLSSCDFKKNIDNNDYITFTAAEDDFIYKHETGQIISYYIDDDGLFYYFANENGDESLEGKIFTVNLDGEVINEISIGFDFFYELLVSDNIAYYYPEYIDETKICSVNLETGEINTIYVIEDFLKINNMVLINDILYILGIEIKATARDYKLFKTSDDYFYFGEIIRSFNLKTGEVSDLFTELPINFSEMFNGNLMIHAYDENGGYYFQEYNTKSNSYGERIYIKYDLSSRVDGDFLITQDYNIIYKKMNTLQVSNLHNEELKKSMTELISDTSYLLENIAIYKSGYLFIKTDKEVRRIYLNKIFRSPIVLTMGYVYKGTDFPNNYGFYINNRELNYDEFALSVLSGDSDIDFFLINSTHKFADNIRNKGAFYKLNDIPGVMDYLNASFPYIKEAAINKNGEVWMIPYSLSTFTVEYNQKVWDRYNQDINSIQTMEELINKLYYFKENNIDETYLINANEFIYKYFYQLIKKNNGFNREDFKKMAELSYEKLNFTKNHMEEFIYGILLNKTTKTDIDSITGGLFNGHVTDGVVQIGSGLGLNRNLANEIANSSDYSDYNEAKNDILKSFFSVSQYVNLRRISIPSIEGQKENDVTCEFFYVNPNSKNLDLVLEYISEYCKDTLGGRNTFILKDKSTYDDRVYINDFYNIFNADNYIRFGLTDELFYEDFVKFLSDEINLEDYLTTIEQKIKTYLKE